MQKAVAVVTPLDKDGIREDSLFLHSTLTFGKDSSCDFSIDKSGAARKQATIFLDENGTCLLKQLSKSGITKVNDVRLSEPVELLQNDIISIGEKKFLFEKTSMPTRRDSNKTASSILSEQETKRVTRGIAKKMALESNKSSEQAVCEAIAIRLQRVEGHSDFRKLDNPFMNIGNKRSNLKKIRNHQRKTGIQVAAIEAQCTQISIASFADELKMQGVEEITAYETAMELFADDSFDENGDYATLIMEADEEEEMLYSLTENDKIKIADYGSLLMDSGCEQEDAFELAVDSYVRGLEKCRKSITVVSSISTPTPTPVKNCSTTAKKARKQIDSQNAPLFDTFAEASVDSVVVDSVALDNLLSSPETQNICETSASSQLSGETNEANSLQQQVPAEITAEVAVEVCAEVNAEVTGSKTRRKKGPAVSEALKCLRITRSKANQLADSSKSADLPAFVGTQQQVDDITESSNSVVVSSPAAVTMNDAVLVSEINVETKNPVLKIDSLAPEDSTGSWNNDTASRVEERSEAQESTFIPQVEKDDAPEAPQVTITEDMEDAKIMDIVQNEKSELVKRTVGKELFTAVFETKTSVSVKVASCQTIIMVAMLSLYFVYTL